MSLSASSAIDIHSKAVPPQPSQCSSSCPGDVFVGGDVCASERRSQRDGPRDARSRPAVRREHLRAERGSLRAARPQARVRALVPPPHRQALAHRVGRRMGAADDARPHRLPRPHVQRRHQDVHGRGHLHREGLQAGSLERLGASYVGQHSC
eukprot:6208188-Pleurochrysis_carterae.AAC.9